ncbi:MAG: DUF928 domain-containing protein [Microcystaceae cyanobacterium]
MLTNFPYRRTLVLTGLILLMGGGGLDPLPPTLASSASEQSSVSVPNRRKPGGSRQLAELPGRRKPGGARNDYAELPGRRKPGGARSDIALLLEEKLFANTATYCNKELRQMTALIPENLQGLTASATPTLYFAVPALSSAPELEFVLQDQQKRVIYTAKITPQLSGGIMAVNIPSSQALEGNQTYHWYLSAICDPNYRERDLVVEGLIQRVNTDQADPSMSSVEQVQFYQQNNLWQDALHATISLYQEEGTTARVQAAWQDYLKSINLTELSDLLSEEPSVAQNKT